MILSGKKFEAVLNLLLVVTHSKLHRIPGARPSPFLVSALHKYAHEADNLGYDAGA